MSDDDADEMYSQLEELGEVVSDEWELIHTEVVKEDNEEFDLTKLSVSEEDASPTKRSSQDNSGYKVRYAYSPVRNSPKAESFVNKWKL